MIHAKHAIEQGAAGLSQSANTETIGKYVGDAKRIEGEFKKIDTELNNIGLAQKAFRRHERMIKKGVKDAETQAFTTAYQKNKHSQRGVVNEKIVSGILTRMKNNSIEGYKTITGLRSAVTKQTIVYHLQNGNKEFQYTVDEEEYIKMLEGENMGSHYGKKMWKSIKEAIKNKQSINFSDLFSLKTSGDQEKLKKHQKKGVDIINLKKDKLYQYLVDSKSITNRDGKVVYSRIAELYSQAKISFRWIYESGEITWLTEKRKNDLNAWIGKYKEAGLHVDTDTFYESGDATESELVLIENKVGSARIRIGTIRSAIQDIAKLNIRSAEGLKQGLINLFTKEPKTGKLDEEIQKGAYDYAVKEIGNFVNGMSLTK